jgi:hypothetical protein
MISAVGQIVGVVMVAVSLVYLASQVRLANRISKAEAWRVANGMWVQINLGLASDPVFRSAFLKVYAQNATRDELDPDERVIAGLWMSSCLSAQEQMHREYLEGILPAEVLGTGDEVFRLPYLKSAWPVIRGNHGEEFAAYMEKAYGLAAGMDAPGTRERR